MSDTQNNNSGAWIGVWRPIGTHPRDATKVLLCEGRRRLIGFYGREPSGFPSGWRITETKEMWPPPTHWMPLPPLPEDVPVSAKAAVQNATSATESSAERVVRHPTFDADGYPTEETELAIKAWDVRDAPGWMAYIREAWNHHYGRMWEESGMLKMATGGWSGNESIIHAMRENHVLWALLWESSHRGGLEVLKMPNPV